MPVTPTATLIVNDGSTGDLAAPYELTRIPGGWVGRKTFLINTGHLDRAFSAAGLPALFERWSPELPGVVATRIGPPSRYTPRGLPNVDASEGFCLMPVEYGSEGGGGAGVLSKPVPAPNLAYCEFEPLTLTQTIRYPIRRQANFVGGDEPNASAAPPFPIIANGDGAPVEASILRARVVVFTTEEPDCRPFLRLMRPAHLNDAAIVLPARAFGATNRYELDEGQAKYAGFSDPVKDAGLWKVVHTIDIAEDWYVRWQPENDKGQAIAGTTYFDDVYPKGSFASLWPA
jgi:hypothetical protein